MKLELEHTRPIATQWRPPPPAAVLPLWVSVDEQGTVPAKGSRSSDIIAKSKPMLIGVEREISSLAISLAKHAFSMKTDCIL
jgi:hypothetical protein